MSKSGFITGLASAGVLSILWKGLSYVVKFLSTIMLYFGLYIPFFYLLYGVIVKLTLNVVLFDFSTNSQLYLLGLLLCCVSSVIISVRNIVLEPIKNILKIYDRNRGPEKPLIYRSNIMPDLIIYEYSNHYDVYREYNGRLSYLRTEGK